MKFSIYDTERKRYLSEEELEGYFYFTGQFDRSYPRPNEYIERFTVNLVTGKVEAELSTPARDTYEINTDRFRLEVIND